MPKPRLQGDKEKLYAKDRPPHSQEAAEASSMRTEEHCIERLFGTGSLNPGQLNILRMLVAEDATTADLCEARDLILPLITQNLSQRISARNLIGTANRRQEPVSA